MGCDTMSYYFTARGCSNQLYEQREWARVVVNLEDRGPGAEAADLVVNALYDHGGDWAVIRPEFFVADYDLMREPTGKVLVMLNNDPEWDPALFEGNTRLYYGRGSYKYEIAAELGAIGAIIIHTTPSAGYPWQVVQTKLGLSVVSMSEDRTAAMNSALKWVFSQAVW